MQIVRRNVNPWKQELLYLKPEYMKHTACKSTSLIALGFLIFLSGCVDASKKQAEPEPAIEVKEIQWTRDQEAVKATVERFLIWKNSQGHFPSEEYERQLEFGY